MSTDIHGPRPGEDSAAPGARRARVSPRIAVPVVVVSASFMNVMDVTIVNVALPSIGHSLHKSTSSLSGVSVAYLLGLAVVIPPAAWIGRRLGMKRAFLTAIALFTASSALCGVAPSFPVLVAARFLQGIGGGAMIPIGMAMLLQTFTPAERVRVSSITVIPTALGPAVGPVVGGLLVTDLSWRWVFYINLPIGLAALVFGSRNLIAQKPDRSGAFDVWGFVLASGGFAAVLYGLTSGASQGWGSPIVIATLVGGIVFIAILLRVETRTAEPILAFRLYRNRLFRSGSVAFIAGAAALFGLLFAVPLFLQIGLGHSALQTGLITFPEALGVIIGGQLTSRVLYPRLGPRRLVVAGLIGVTGCALALTVVDAHTDLWLVRAMMLALGISMGPVYLAAQTAAFATVDHADMAQASALYNSQRQFGTAAGIAILSTVLSLHHGGTAGGRSQITGYHHAFAVAALFSVAGLVVARAISDRDAAATVVRRPRTKQFKS